MKAAAVVGVVIGVLLVLALRALLAMLLLGVAFPQAGLGFFESLALVIAADVILARPTLKKD